MGAEKLESIEENEKEEDEEEEKRPSDQIRSFQIVEEVQ